LKSFKNLLLVLLLFVGSAESIELGEMQLDSHLNETLDATFTIGNINASDLDDIKVNIAGVKAYQALGLSRPAYLSRLTFNITAGEGLQHSIKVNSRQRLSDPIIELLVEVTEKQSKLMRLYTLMLDPFVTAIASESSKDTVTQRTANQLITPTPVTLLNEVTQSTQSTPVVEKHRPAVVYDSSVSTIRVDNASISIIAENSSLHDKYSVYQIMRAFYLQNPQAFLNGNINKLESGVLLQVPLEQVVAEIPRQKAINFVYSVSTDKPSLKSADVPPALKPAVGRLEVSNSAIETDAVPLMLSSTLPQDFPQTVQISSDVQQDLISWRGMTDEFKSLSEIVGQQNQVIKLQSDVVKDISIQLDTRTDQLSDFDKRLMTLEQSLTATQVITAADQPAANGMLQELNQIKQQQSLNMEQVNAQLDVKNQEISRLNARILELENGLAVGLPIDQGNLLVEDTSQPAEIIVSVSDAEQAGLLQDSRVWMLIVGSIVMLFVVREYSLRRRIRYTDFLGKHKTRGSAITPVAEEVKQSVEAMSQLHRKKPDARELTDSIAMKLDIQEKNKKSAKELKSRSKESAQAGQKAPRSSLVDINAVNQVHAEIDVLIAYELFVEAQDLVDSTMQKHKEDRWLVVKELEILAYLKDVDLFLSRVEHEKNQLSKEFPVAWQKILKMRDDLCSEFKLASIH